MVAIVWLSCVVYSLNFMTIGTLASFIRSELHFSYAQIGLLCSAVMLGSMLSQIPAGVLCDIVSPRCIMSSGLFIIGVSAIASSFAYSYSSVFIFLLLLGVGIGCNQAPASKVIVTWFHKKGKATAMGIKETGVPVGGIIASFSLPAIALQLNNWRFSFRAAGLASLLLAVLIILVLSEKETTFHNDLSFGKISFRKHIIFEVFLKKDFILICISGFFLMAAQFAFSTHFISYCTSAFYFPISRSGYLLALSFGSGALARVGWSLLSDYLLEGSRNTTLFFIGIIGSLAAIAFIMMKIFSLSYFVFFFALLFGSTGMGWNAIFLTQVAELSGHKFAGTATGIAFLILNTGGIFGPSLFGYLVDLTGNYKLSWGFVASCMGMVAVLNQIQRRAT